MGSGSDGNGNFHDILGIKFEDSEECNSLYFNIEPATKRMFGKEGSNLDSKENKIKVDKNGKVTLKTKRKKKKKKKKNTKDNE